MERQERFFAAISYLGFLCIVTLAFKKNSAFALSHAKQGLILFVFETAAFLLSIMPPLFWLVRYVASLIFLLVSAWGVVQSMRGLRAPIPYISKLAEEITL